MSDVKPDTSLYSALEMKLHALAKALKGKPGELLEEMEPFRGAWVLAHGSAADFMVRLANGCEYRIKPKPRVLWAVYTERGDWLYSFPTEDAAKNHAKGVPFVGKRKIVRFVEQPDTEA